MDNNVEALTVAERQ